MTKYSIGLWAVIILFFACAKDEPVVYELTVTSTQGGEVNISGGSYEAGTEIQILATPGSEYVFVGWSNGSTANPLTILLNADQTIEAQFAKKKYELQVQLEGQGSVVEKIINTGKGYDSGTQLELTAIPEGEWVFSSWSGDVVRVP